MKAALGKYISLRADDKNPALKAGNPQVNIMGGYGLPVVISSSPTPEQVFETVLVVFGTPENEVEFPDYGTLSVQTPKGIFDINIIDWEIKDGAYHKMVPGERTYKGILNLAPIFKRQPIYTSKIIIDHWRMSNDRVKVSNNSLLVSGHYNE